MANRKFLVLSCGAAVLAAGAVLILKGSWQATKIRDIVANPDRYTSHSVTISCIASEGIMPDVWDKFMCADGTGSLMVVVNPPAPAKGSRVTVRGRVCFSNGLLTWFCEDGTGVPGLSAP
jgi:hypothetical protein